MKPRLMFARQVQVIRTHSVARDAAFAFGAIAILLVLLAWAQAHDQAAADARVFAAGQVVGREEMAETVAAAYRQGRLDAQADLGTVLGVGCSVPDQVAAQAQRGQP